MTGGGVGPGPDGACPARQGGGNGGPSPSPELRIHLLAAAAYLTLAALLARPALSRFTTHLWGDTGDAWQNWWNGWWFSEALRRGVSPMRTDLLWYPDGANLWLHTLGPLNAALTAAGQALLPGFSGYNLLVLLHLAFGAYGGFVLCRAVLRSGRRIDSSRSDPPRWIWELAAFGGGAAFGFSPYVWTHVSVHLHLTGLGFAALLVHAMLEARKGRRRWCLVGALWALCTAGCGWYPVLAGAVAGSCLLAGAALGRRWDEVNGLALLAGLSALVMLPLAWPTLSALDAGLSGAHDPVEFSADLLSFWVPSPALAAGRWFTDLTGRFTGNAGENGGYLGYAALLLSAVGAARLCSSRLWALMAAGAGASVLSLGPHLHVAGAVLRRTSLPYAWLVDALPVFGAFECPVRLSLPVNLALGAGVAAGLAAVGRALWRRARRSVPVAGALVVGVGLVMLEYLPARQLSSVYASPPWLRELANDPASFTVLDLCGWWTHPLYNQTLHGHAIPNGYLSRVPTASRDRLLADPVLEPLYRAVIFGWTGAPLRATRIDRRLDFDWGAGSPAEGVPDDFRAEWVGGLSLEHGGSYTFFLEADDAAELSIDGQPVVEERGASRGAGPGGLVDLEPGLHRVRIAFRDDGGDARMRWRWQGPGFGEEIVPEDVLRTASGERGLTGRYFLLAGMPRLGAEEALDLLRSRWKVRYVLAYEGRQPWALTHVLGLELVARSHGLVLFELPRPSRIGREQTEARGR